MARPILAEVSADKGEDFGRAFVEELRRPRDEVLETHGAGDLKLYEKLLSDPKVMSTFWQRRAAVVARETRVEPGGPTDLDKLAADSLERQLKGIAWDRTTLRMLNGAMFGRSVAECMFETDGHTITLAQVKVRRSRRFRFGVDGSLRLMTDGKPNGEVMPDQKFWCATFGAEDDDDPDGRGLGHWLYWPVWLKRNAIRFWAVFLERFSSPTAVATVPQGMTEPDRAKVAAMLDAIRNGGRAVKSGGITLDLLQAMRDSGGDYERFVLLMDREITTVNLTQTMTTDDGSSRAQGEVHERMGSMVSQVDADLLCESFMRGPARWLTEWNFPGAAIPRIYRDFSQAKDLAASAERDTKLHSIGYRPTEARIEETYGEGYERTEPIAALAPIAPTPSEPVLDAPPTSTPDVQAAAPPVEIPLTATDIASIVTVDESRAALGLGPMPSGAGALTVAQYQAQNASTIAAANAATSGEVAPPAAPAFAESIDAKAAAGILGEQGWRKVIGPEADAVAKVLEEATDLEDARKKLATHASSSPSSELVETLARSMFAARLQANAELGDEDTSDDGE